MTEHEIDAERGPPAYTYSSSDEKHAVDNDKTSESEIVEYLYLDFDTPLPTPAGLSSPRPGQSPPPKCPNLKKYASPFLWSKARKAVTTMICCAVTAMASYAAGEYTPAATYLMHKWHVSRVVYNVGITLFTLGFGIAPMVLAPFSEFNGRRPIFILSGVVFTGQHQAVHLICDQTLLTPLTYSFFDWMWCNRVTGWDVYCKVLPRRRRM